jgi:hypothetical protein
MKTELKNIHTVNAWAKLVRTPRFKMQVVVDRKKQQNKTAARKPVTTEALKRVVF